MHSKLGGSFTVPEKFLQKNAAELAKETEKAEKTAESKKKMNNKAAATTTEQAVAKHVVKHIVSEGDLDEVRELTPALTLE